MTFTVVGAATGKVFATGASALSAASWAAGYRGPGADGLLRLGIGESWCSHPELPLGIRVTRTS